MKRCSKCKVLKPSSEFYPRKDRAGGSGLRSHCKSCAAPRARERAREWFAAHRDEANAARRERWAAMTDAERERHRERDRDRRQTETRREYQRRWRKENAEALRAITARHRMRFPAHLRATTDAMTVEYARLLAGDPCGFCGRFNVELDHITPVAAGGITHWTNLAALCRTCNASKNDRPLLVARLSAPLRRGVRAVGLRLDEHPK